VGNITPDILNTYVTTAGATRADGDEAKAKGSVNHVKSSLKSFFTWAFHLGYVTENPSRCLRVKYLGRSIPSYLTPEQQAALLATMGKDASDPLAARDLVLAKLFLTTGMRLSEALSLNVADLDLANRKLTLRQVKGGGQSVKFLNADTTAVLEAHLAKRDKHDGPLFESKPGRRLSTRQVQVRFGQWFKRAGLDESLTVHSLRHTFATRLFGKTKNILLVQKALDHRHITTTQIYAHIDDAELAAAVELV
jgi:integrase/recombinase XerC